MNCPRCGKPTPPGAGFCMNCGQALAPQRPQPMPQAQPMRTGAMPAAQPMVAAGGYAQAMPGMDPAAKRRTTLIGAAIAIVLLLLALVGLKATGVLKLGGKSPNFDGLSAKGTMPGGALSKGGQPGGPALEAKAEKPEGMPRDIYDWLKHLEKCERMKMEISGDQQTEMILFATKLKTLGADIGLEDPFDQVDNKPGDKDPAEYTKGKMLNLKPRWQELITFFRSVPPPEECKPIADDFDRALSEVPGMTGDIADILNTVNDSPEEALSKVRKFQNSSYGDIDRYFIRCDRKVGDICAKYHVNKWFNIKADTGDSGMLQKLGGSGL